jgi:type I restriction enzyme, R subunit
VRLSQLIDLVNERFGTDFDQAGELFFDQIVEEAMTDEGLRQAAAVNPGDKFELLFKNVLEKVFVDSMDQHEDVFVRFMNDPAFRKVVTTWMAEQAYRRLRSDAAVVDAADTAAGAAHCSRLRVIQPSLEERYVTCVPLLTLKAAAGAFGDAQQVDKRAQVWAAAAGTADADTLARHSFANLPRSVR